MAAQLSDDSAGQSTTFVMLLDHDNVPWSRVSIEGLLRLWLERVSSTAIGGVVDVRLRSYGGWFSGDAATERRFAAFEFYQRSCPTLLKVDDRFVRVTFEFADSMLLISGGRRKGLPIRHTYVTRASGQTLKSRGGAATCHETDCEVRRIRKWIGRRRACPRAACPLAFSDCFVREEQKQVDIHLAMDLIYLCWVVDECSHVAVVTDDTDLIPALVTAVEGPMCASVSHVRCNLNDTYMDPFLDSLGVQVIVVS